MRFETLGGTPFVAKIIEEFVESNRKKRQWEEKHNNNETTKRKEK